MIKRLLNIFKSSPTPTDLSAEDIEIISRDGHDISRSQISDPAIKVLYRLKKGGYQSFLVGGGVRDLLLGLNPKDFDVATDAKPEQVKNLFRNCRLIGRRFRLAHILFGREIIEVATFRGHHKDHHDSDTQSRVGKDGMILRDNVYGSLEEDMSRRDFTINALYYNIADFSVYGYPGGMNDLKKRQLRMIGDPTERYQEDPVRMLRAARFAAKLNFKIEKKTEKPIFQLTHLLRSVPAARLFEEVLKLLSSGYGVASFEQLEKYKLLEQLFPTTAKMIDPNNGDVQSGLYREVLLNTLRNTDRRLAEGKSVTPAFMYGALLWPEVHHEMETLITAGVPPMSALHQAAQQAIGKQVKLTAIPKRFSLVMKDIWELQLRLQRRQGNRAEAALSHPKFRAGYDFLLIREQSGEDLEGLGEWWTQYQVGDENQRQEMRERLQGKNREKGKRRYSGKKRRPQNRRKKTNEANG